MIIDGKKISEEIKEEVKLKTIKLKEKGITPTLAIILIGNDAPSIIYDRNKIKACEKVGIKAYLYHFKENDKEEDVIKKIKELNSDNNVHGIVIQSPVPNGFNEEYLMNLIDKEKDVDGFGTYNLGCLVKNKENIIAATPLGIIKLLEHENIDIAGKYVVIVGRSKIVGKPLMLALLNRNATVCITHTYTKNLKNITHQADILIVAIGCSKFITKDYVKEGAIVIDVGINRNIDGTIVGDVDFKTVKEKASLITPVPGGVGPITIASLLLNLIKLVEKRMDKNG